MSELTSDIRPFMDWIVPCVLGGLTLAIIAGAVIIYRVSRPP